MIQNGLWSSGWNTCLADTKPWVSLSKEWKQPKENNYKPSSRVREDLLHTVTLVITRRAQLSLMTDDSRFCGKGCHRSKVHFVWLKSPNPVTSGSQQTTAPPGLFSPSTSQSAILNLLSPTSFSLPHRRTVRAEFTNFSSLTHKLADDCKHTGDDDANVRLVTETLTFHTTSS